MFLQELTFEIATSTNVLPGVCHLPALLPGVAPPHADPTPEPIELAFVPVAYGFGARKPMFHAGVRPPSAYGFGVRDDAFHAGVRLPA